MDALGLLLARVARLFSATWIAGTLVTLITFGVITAVVLVNTPAGCKVGVRTTCTPAAAHVSPTQYGAKPGYVYSPPVSAPQPVGPGPNYPSGSNPGPYSPPASQAYPPGNLHDPNLPPYEFNTGASGAYSPVPPATSAGGVTDVSFSCRLPLYAGGSGSGGFLVLPDRSFVADPRSAVSLPSPSPGASPPPQMGYYQQFGLSYDSALGKWLPVQHQWVSPDGKHYAYPDAFSGLYVVDVSTSLQVELGEGKRWQILEVENASVYAAEVQQPGLWQLPFAGAARQISMSGYWQAVGGGAAYGTATSAVPPGVTATILRMDLATGASQPWFQLDGAQPYVAGFDVAGHPLMWVNSSAYGQYTTYVWIVYGLGDATVLVSGQLYGTPVADSHGIWVSSNQSIVLVVPGTGSFVVANIGGQVAGACV